MGDSLLGSIQGLFGFFILLVGVLIGWFSNEKVKKEEKMTVSDAYVRDHLLIQFMLHNYAPISFSEYGKRFEEDVYNNWIRWIKEMGEQHDKRSTV